MLDFFDNKFYKYFQTNIKLKSIKASESKYYSVN